MKSGSFLAIGVVMMAGLSQASAQAPAPPQVDPNAPVYTVGYLDIANSSKNAALPLLKQFVNLCRKEEGVLRCEVAQRLEQPNQFVTLGAWKDKKSFDAHLANPTLQALRDKLAAMSQSPYDRRIHTGMSVAQPQPAPSGRITYVVTHVDVVPPRTNDAVPLLTQAAEAARKETGNARFEVLQQANRPNHFSVVEVWPNRKVFETRSMSPGVIQFRKDLQPMAGALYDQRLYKVLD
jgi:quinol monooxygenase YgiN